MSYVLGLDLGTSGLKGLLVDKSGNLIETATAEYPLHTPEKGYSEQNPEDWYDASIKILRKLINEFPEISTELEGISFSGQMHTLVLLNNQGNVLRNAILWNDVRTTKQCEMIMDNFGDRLLSITKNKALEGFTLPKMLWVQENEPEVWKKTAKFLLPKDYLGYRLTDNMQMDYSDAAGTLLLDVDKKEWSNEILKEFNVQEEICPPLVESTTKIGYLKDDIAREVGIKNKIPIFSGGGDNPIAAVGAGILQKGQAMASIGTSGVFLSYEGESKLDYKGYLHYFNHVIPDMYYSMGVTLAAGSSLNWFKDLFSSDLSFADILGSVKDIPEGSDGLLFAPYLSGERTPYTDSRIRGTFLGLDISHTRDHLARAVLEGITFSLKDSFELMKKHSNKEFKQIVSVGGGAKNDDWLQMQADIFNVPIVTLETEQGPAMGAVMVAAVGVGWFQDFKSCSDIFVRYGDEILPNSRNVEKYEEIYDLYQEIYPTIKDLSHRLVKR